MKEGRKEREAEVEKRVRRRERGVTSQTVCPGWPQKGEDWEKAQREANGRTSQARSDSDKPIERKEKREGKV